MFNTINDVPGLIRDFYEIYYTTELVFDDDQNPVMVDEQYTYIDENGAEQTGTRQVQDTEQVEQVRKKVPGEFKSYSDIETLALKLNGSNDELIRSYISMHSELVRWSFHDDYLDWHVKKEEIEALETLTDPSHESGYKNGFTPTIKQQMMDDHATTEPDEVTEIDIDNYMLENYSKLRYAAYPPKHIQFEMMYDDQVNGTTTFRDAIDAVKLQYPKPA